MDPKKDVSTAILDQKKAPNKLIVPISPCRSTKPSTIRTPRFRFQEQKWQNSNSLKETLSSSREKNAKRLSLSASRTIN